MVVGKVIRTRDDKQWVVVLGQNNQPALCVGIETDSPKYLVIEKYEESVAQTTQQFSLFIDALTEYQLLLDRMMRAVFSARSAKEFFSGETIGGSDE